MSGVSHWCLGESNAAVADWLTGLKAQYSDTAGLEIRLPLLLFSASILRPESFQRREAEGILQEKVQDERASHWPERIAKFVLDQVGDESVLALTPLTRDFDRKHRQWVVEFYRHLLEFGRGDLTPAQFSGVMHRATAVSEPECCDQDYFLSLMWSEEFFMARHRAYTYLRLDVQFRKTPKLSVAFRARRSPNGPTQRF